MPAEVGGIAVLIHSIHLSYGILTLGFFVAEWARQRLAILEVHHLDADLGNIPVLLGIAERRDLLLTESSDLNNHQVKPGIATCQGLNRWHTMKEEIQKSLTRIGRESDVHSCDERKMDLHEGRRQPRL